MAEAQSKWYHWIRRWSADEAGARIYLGLLSAEYEALDLQRLSKSEQDKTLYRRIGDDLAVWTHNGSGKIPDWVDLCSLEARLLRLLPQDACK